VFAEGECPLAFSDDFCAGGTSGYTCQGDSGGPIVRATSEGDELVGLTSFGDADCYTPYSYYVRVADHLGTVNGWMQQTVPRWVCGQLGGGGAGRGAMLTRH
jgi:secreted trypsin-like serine protease